VAIAAPQPIEVFAKLFDSLLIFVGSEEARFGCHRAGLCPPLKLHANNGPLDPVRGQATWSRIHPGSVAGWLLRKTICRVFGNGRGELRRPGLKR
jgi:hypothetical protein